MRHGLEIAKGEQHVEPELAGLWDFQSLCVFAAKSVASGMQSLLLRQRAAVDIVIIMTSSLPCTTPKGISRQNAKNVFTTRVEVLAQAKVEAKAKAAPDWCGCP